LTLLATEPLFRVATRATARVDAMVVAIGGRRGVVELRWQF
jgi:hypothetical protein